VIYAADGAEGFRMACREDPVVIVTDYFMENGDAQYLLTKLRTNAATGNVPVVVWTGRTLDVVKLEALQRKICGHPGAAKILRKSGDTSELFQTLKEICGFEPGQWARGEFSGLRKVAKGPRDEAALLAIRPEISTSANFHSIRRLISRSYDR
jgi:CheY-like chemotaxis protein